MKKKLLYLALTILLLSCSGLQKKEIVGTWSFRSYSDNTDEFFENIKQGIVQYCKENNITIEESELDDMTQQWQKELNEDYKDIFSNLRLIFHEDNTYEIIQNIEKIESGKWNLNNEELVIDGVSGNGRYSVQYDKVKKMIIFSVSENLKDQPGFSKLKNILDDRSFDYKITIEMEKN